MASEAVILLTCERDMYAYPPKSNTQDHRLSQMWLRLPTEMALAFRNKTSLHTLVIQRPGITCLRTTYKTAALMKTSGMMWFRQATKVSADKQGHAAGTCEHETLQEHAAAACTHSSMYMHFASRFPSRPPAAVSPNCGWSSRFSTTSCALVTALTVARIRKHRVSIACGI